jgi:hypothetical protein
MTSSSLPPENLDADLLASLYLDGEASPEEAAVVEATPDLMARVEAFRAVAGRLSEPVRPPATLQRAHIAAALDAFETTASAPAIPQETAPVVVDLAERRARRGLPSWLGAAAATIVVVGGIGFGLSALNSSGSSDEATDAASSREGATANSETTAAESEELFAADSAMEDGDGTADDSAAADSAEEESVMAEEAEPAADAGGTDEVLAPPFDPGPVDGRSALEIADTVPPEQILPIDDAACLGSAVATSLEELTGFVPILLDDEAGELLFFLTPDADGQLVPGAVVLGLDCELILE